MNTNLMPWMRWHRWAGLAIAIFIVLLCVTGILLNHGASLGLSHRYIASPWLLDLYGIAPESAPRSFEAGGHRVTSCAGRLYFDDRALTEQAETLIGAVALQDQLVVALPGRLLFLAMDGNTIEILGIAEGVPPDISRIGTAPGGRLIVGTTSGPFSPDLDTLAWTPSNTSDVVWSAPAALPVEMAKRIVTDARSHVLTMERVLQDVHSGRIATRFGAWFMDLVALVLLSLALSGIWIWWNK